MCRGALRLKHERSCACSCAERAMSAMPHLPLFHRTLNDDMLVDILQRIAFRLSYGLR